MEEKAKGRDAMETYRLGAGETLLPGGCRSPPGEGTLPCLGAEGLWLLPWAEGPVTTSLWWSSCFWAVGGLGGCH